MKRFAFILALAAAWTGLIACQQDPKPAPPAAKPSAPSAAKSADAPKPADTPAPPVALALPAITPLPAPKPAAPIKGWLTWRGPHQNGTSDEAGLPLALDKPLWTYDIASRGTPVIANGMLYFIGYEGEKADFQEVLLCLDAETGQKKWEFRSNDFLSDVVYDRYAIGSPTIDPQTGLLYYLSTPGILYCFTPEGKIAWNISLAERYGRNTYPNGRTGAPVIDGDLVITRGVTNNWGSEGPPNDRFYAFDKMTGQLVWSSTPGVGPPFLKDSSVSTPVLAWRGGKRVFYCGTGDGNIVCINARDGTAIWRYQFCVGGIGSSPVLHPDGLIALHGLEQPSTEYGSLQGGMVLFNLDAAATAPKPGQPGAPFFSRDAEKWRNQDLVAFTSSPVLVGDRIYQTTDTGILFCINAKTGKTVWQKKFAPDQIHAGPTYGDGKLYVPFNNGTFVIVKPTDEGPQELARTQLDGFALGAPAIWNGKVYVTSLKHLYCFGPRCDKDESPVWPTEKAATPGKPAKLQAIPAEVVLHPGEKADFRVRAVDADGHVVGMVKDVKWDYFIPPTARVKSQMDAAFNPAGELVAGKTAKMSAGSFKVTAGPLSGTARGRVLAGLPYKEDFQAFQITENHETEKEADGSPSKFAYPPLAWLKARFSWEIREVDGNKVLAKTLDRLILQRIQTFIEDDSLSNYTMQADVMSDGNRRLASDVGLINQRYQIVLKGNHQRLEVTSNVERINETVPFRIDAKKWYTLKTRVDIKADGSGVVRAKAWPKGEPEPDSWTIEVEHANAHRHGSPGLYGFAINGKFRVYIDNLSITPNEKQ